MTPRTLQAMGSALLLLIPGATVAAGRTVTVDNVEHHNRTVLLDVGDRLIVRLPRHAGTGYHWKVDRNDDALLKPLGDETRSDGPARPGGPQMQEFRFEAVAAGGEELELTLLPPGEPPGEIGDWARYVVVIRDHDQPHTITITERANRDRLELKPGDRIVIRLPAQAGTAYRWALLQPPPDCLRPDGEPGATTKASRPGGPVVQQFCYQAATPGIARLRFSYESATGGGDAPPKRFEVTLVIPKR